jgi:mycothiol synthase
MWRPLTPSDIPSLFELVRTIEEHDRPTSRESLRSLWSRIQAPWQDMAANTLAGFDDDGRMRAWSAVELLPGDLLRLRLDGGVHPLLRQRGIGRALLTWQDCRARQLIVESGRDEPAWLITAADDVDIDHRRLLGAAGFSPSRWFRIMRCPLDGELPDIKPPGQLELVGWTTTLDDEVFKVHTEAYGNPWWLIRASLDAWHVMRTDLVPAWSFVLLDGDSPVGYSMSFRYEQNWEAAGYSAGRTDVIGVLPEYRSQGAGSALLSATMAAMSVDGIEYAEILVDCECRWGPTGALSRLGYEAVAGTTLYTIEA